MLFIGKLRHREEADDGAPVVEAEAVERLVAERATSPAPPSSSRAPAQAPAPAQPTGAGAAPLSSVLTEPSPQPARAPPRKKARSEQLNYYACTRLGCGWSGNRIVDHRKHRKDCLSFPCTVLYTRDTGARAAVAEFIARCTPEQRELGLPPDFEKPVPMAGRDGRIDMGVLYLTVPQGHAPGDGFTVPTGYGMRARITVPPGRVPGDVISIAAS